MQHFPLEFADLPRAVRQIKLPRMALVRQSFPRIEIGEVANELAKKLASARVANRLSRGARVAITAGSRGIDRLPEVLRTLVSYLRERGADPFVVPAMGSHGGATADGQERLLEKYGITERSVGAPIRSSMEVVEVGQTPDGLRVVCDREAWEADAIVLVNRVKPHTAFHGRIESGLLKMLLIGLGKHEGAQYYHRKALQRGFLQVLESVTRVLLASGKVAFGVALVENAYDRLAHIDVIPAEHLLEREPELLETARQLLPRLPVRSGDILIIDEIGKDISGSGMDTNVVGRKRYAPSDADLPEFTRIVVRGLTERTLGNATGIGLADIVCIRAVRAMDYRATAINCLTASHPFGTRIPLCCADDRTALAVAAATCPVDDSCDLRVLRIRNTLRLEHLYVSEAVLREIASREDVEVLSEPAPVRFDQHGQLIPEFVPEAAHHDSPS